MAEPTIKNKPKSKHDTVRMILPRPRVSLPENDLGTTLTIIPPVPGRTNLQRPAAPPPKPIQPSPEPEPESLTEQAPSWHSSTPEREAAVEPQPARSMSQEDIFSGAQALLDQLKKAGH